MSAAADLGAVPDPSWQPDSASGIDIGLLDANGQRFEIATAGQGDHLALCLHGFPELHYSWRHQIPVLAQMGYRVWAPNLRGYGASTRPSGIASYNAETLLADIAAIIDASGCSKITLIAHDWGGALAWMFAIGQLRRIERLVVMNFPHPACFARELGTWRQRWRSWYIAFFQLPGLPEMWLRRNIRSIFQKLAVHPERFPAPTLDIFEKAVLRPGAATAMINWYRAAWRADSSPVSATALVDVPTLLIWGEQDSALCLSCTEGTEAFVPDFALRLLPEASHWVQQDAPAEVNAVLTEWLPGVPTGLAINSSPTK